MFWILFTSTDINTGRNRKTEEGNLEKNGTKQTKTRKSALAPDTPTGKKSKSVSSGEDEDKEIYSLSIRGHNRYVVQEPQRWSGTDGQNGAKEKTGDSYALQWEEGESGSD